VSFEITGVKDVQKILDDIAPKHARNLLRATIQGVASEIAKDARKNAPKDSGTLKKAIKAKRKKSPPDKAVSEVIITHGNSARHDAYYWRFVEYPTQGNTGKHQPFIRPAADKARANFEAILAEQFGKKLEKALAREAKKRDK
jgi:HK97 gp10 family phage protein